MKTIAISIFGQSKDYLNPRNAASKQTKKNNERLQQWLLKTWRPSVALAAQETIHIDEYHLICTVKQHDLAQTVVAGIKHFSPQTKIFVDSLELKNVFDFQTTFIELMDYASSPYFHEENSECLVHLTTGTHVEQICLFLLTQKHYLNGKLVQTYQDDRQLFADPRGRITVVDLNLSAYDKLNQHFQAKEDKNIQSLKDGILTRNIRYNKIIDEIESVIARDTSPILLTGPTGSGKTALARRIYERYKARGIITGAFIAVNCAAIPPNLAESEIFGHAKGAFTGASKDYKGKIERADGGILFLDEIGELPLEIQTKLLKVLEEHSFTRLGSEKEQSSHFILISGTNRNLENAVAERKFREDLLQRINLWTFELPGLSERREDIPPNINHELAQFEKETKTHVEFNKEGRDAFLNYALAPATKWKGNFREFRSMLHRMAVFADGGIITEKIVRNEIQRNAAKNATTVTNDNLASVLGADYEAHIDSVDLVQLKYTLDVCLQSKNAAAAGRILFAATIAKGKNTNPTSRVKQYLARFGLDIDYSTLPPHPVCLASKQTEQRCL